MCVCVCVCVCLWKFLQQSFLLNLAWVLIISDSETQFCDASFFFADDDDDDEEEDDPSGDTGEPPSKRSKPTA